MGFCFFCDIQDGNDDKTIAENRHFFSRFDDFPVSRGHCEVVPKAHVESFFDLSSEQVAALFALILRTKAIIEEEFMPDGYNLGLNEGVAGGRTIHHFHLHIIPRYQGDVGDPKGGVRNIIPGKADYLSQLRTEYPSRRKYV
jgi:diadenosine tetraphosphate (Ap4A) HIT family hydrolase